MDNNKQNIIISSCNNNILLSSITAIRFPLVFSILLLHSYTIQNLPGHPLYFKFLYPFAMWIGETGVPAYFFISGFLFFYSKKTYSLKIRNRIKTLLIPYLIWNGMILASYIMFYIFGHDIPINNQKCISEYTIIDYIRAFWDRGDWNYGDGKPILPPMWYVRNLFILCIMSPIINIIIKKTHFIIPVMMAIVWIFYQKDVYILQSITMFSLGAIFPILNIDIIDQLKKYKTLFFSVFIIITAGDFISHIFWYMPFNYVIHRSSLILNIFSLIWLGIFLSSKKITFKSCSHISFFIFCIHLPFISLIRKPVLNHTEWTDLVHIILYFISVTVCVFLCIFAYTILNKLFPRFVSISTGNRNKKA